MQPKQLHIVSFDVPYPPSYGGVIDIFYKIKALHAAGVQVHLHCFQYGRPASPELDQICASVHYYPRRRSAYLLFSAKPFIVVTRMSEALRANLLKDESPILFEGLHCCALVDDPQLAKRSKLVRTHNIEHDYYAALAKVEKRFFQRRYFNSESKKLKRFEQVLKQAQHVLAISPADAQELAQRYAHVHHVMAFHANDAVNVLPGKGEFALYHGNLEVGENNQAALYLVNEVFSNCKVPLIIAGNKPSLELQQAIAKYPNIELRANISPGEIDELIRQAQINVLPTFQATGIKLKLLVALFSGRHCIVNTPMVANTGLESLCTIADTAAGLQQAIEEKFEKEFDPAQAAQRETILLRDFSNKANAEKILELL